MSHSMRTLFFRALPSRLPERVGSALSLLMLLIMGGFVGSAAWHEAHGIAHLLVRHHPVLLG